MGNFKRKKYKGYKEVHWGAPKHLKRNNQPRTIRGFKKKPCIFTKGKHEYKFIKTKPMWLYHFIYSRCGCGKRATDHMQQ